QELPDKLARKRLVNQVADIFLKLSEQFRHGKLSYQCKGVRTLENGVTYEMASLVIYGAS
ncbi:MAG: hypothetical protein OEU51_05530, partial [Gammaproteobacteria bacterium]|nr:hypothetical protein [Gammaproteobacteria bacterium]